MFSILLTLSLLACGNPGNPPEINGVIVNQEKIPQTLTVEIGITEKADFQVFATDDDDDPLTYTFRSNRGKLDDTQTEIQNSTGKVLYTPPETPGEDMIEIVVSDHTDGSDRWQIRMMIVENRGKVSVEVTWEDP